VSYTIAYYLAHRDIVDAELAAQESQAARLREGARVRNADLRSRLADARATWSQVQRPFRSQRPRTTSIPESTK
jgi:hypothetical protein